MTNQEIYDAVLHVIAETNSDAYTADFQERFPYILALFCGEAELLDSKYRKSKGLPKANCCIRIAADLGDDFPLTDIFLPPAIYYTASLLIADENPELSDKFFEKYSTGMANIYKNLPSELSKIKNVYF